VSDEEQHHEEPSLEVGYEKGRGTVRLSGSYTVYVGPYLKYPIIFISFGGAITLICYGLSFLVNQ
jgi:hypothetical protein